MELPIRKSIRLKEFDYSSNGGYFITICTHNKECILGDIVDGEMVCNGYGKIIDKNINILKNLYEGIHIEKYVIMPNHIHMIVSICRECIACIPPSDRTKMIIPKVIQVFKSSVTKDIRHAYNACPTKIWQPRYHEHVIRNEKEYQGTWEYIDTNPLKWELDVYHTQQ